MEYVEIIYRFDSSKNDYYIITPHHIIKPIKGSYTLTVPSLLQLIIWWLSCVNIAWLTKDVWPRNSFRVRPDFKPCILGCSEKCKLIILQINMMPCKFANIYLWKKIAFWTCFVPDIMQIWKPGIKIVFFVITEKMPDSGVTLLDILFLYQTFCIWPDFQYG